jgi:phage host-nuclease inhibitor protein Gam
MRVSHWWCALLVLGYVHTAYADDSAKETTKEAAKVAATDDASTMEVIEMLGEMDDEVTDLEIAMSDEKLNETPAAQEVKNAE